MIDERLEVGKSNLSTFPSTHQAFSKPFRP